MKRILIRAWDWFDEFYIRFAKALLIFCLVAATGGVFIGTTAQLQSGKAIDANVKLVECLNRQAAENSRAQSAVREAAELKDIAVTSFNATLAAEGDAFLNVVEAIISADLTDEQFASLLQRLERTLQLRADANLAVINAQIHLDQTRKDYPIPPPPSVFCDLTKAEARGASTY